MKMSAQECESGIMDEHAADMKRRSPSPSAVSTASSGSPLLRSNSSSSATSATGAGSGASSPAPAHQARRPAPTSIAAAQLQQQRANCGAQAKLPAGNKLAQMGWRAQQAAALAASQQQSHSAPQPQPQANVKKAPAGDKTPGHDLGKLIAYRARRFNEFWSANKMRYMNLACLLMTLGCLLTILLFSKQSSPLGAARLAGRAETPGEQQQQQQPLSLALAHRRRASSSSPASEDEATTTTTRPLGEPADEALREAKRQLKRQQESEREAEAAEATLASATATATPTTTSSWPPVSEEGAARRRPQLEPLLSQVFDDLDNFGLFRALKAQLLGGVANLTQLGRPIVRRNRNGATIIMSFGGGGSSANANATAVNGTLGGLLERLLPRPQSLLPDGLDELEAEDSQPAGLRNRPSGFATITINSSPFLASAHAPPPFAQFLAPPAPFALLGRPAPLASPPLPLPGGLLNMLLRASSELAAEAQLEPEAVKTGKTGGNASEPLLQQASQGARAAAASIAGANATEKAPAAASHQNGPESASGGDEDDEVETFDVGQLLARRHLQLAPANFARAPGRSTVYAARARPHSMIMISSAANSAPGGALFGPADGPLDAPLANLAAPFFQSHERADAPHMFMLAGGGQSQPLPQLLSPMLRAVFQRVARTMEPRETSGRRDDQEPAEADEWDEAQLPGARLRARHRSDNNNEEEESGAGDAPQPQQQTAFSAGSLIEQLLESNGGGAGGAGGRLTGTIKQVFRGPGMTVERVIELPAAGPQQTARHFKPAGGDEELAAEVQLVPRGARMQSISRLDAAPSEGEDGSEGESGAEQAAPGESFKREAAAASQSAPTFASFLQERADADLAGARPRGPLLAPPFHPANLLGRLFAEPAAERAVGEQQPLPPPHPLALPMGAIFASLGAGKPAGRQLRANWPAAADLDGDSASAPEQQQQQQQQQAEERPEDSAQAGLWSPKFRVATARVRLSSRLDAPARFSVAAEPPTRQELAGRADQAAEPVASGEPFEAPAARQQRAMRLPARLPAGQPAGSPFTSPGSPLFGFPAMKAAPAAPVAPALAPQAAGAGQQQQLQARSGENTSARPFVYHSNHELAAGALGRSSEPRELPAPQQQQQQQQQQARPFQQAPPARSSYQHRNSAPAGLQTSAQIAGLPAAIGMGRRLDEGELVR